MSPRVLRVRDFVEIKAFCQMNDFNYQTITNNRPTTRLVASEFSNKGDCRRTEVSYNAPAAMPAVEQNLSPER